MMKTFAYCSFLEKVNSKLIYEEIMRYCHRNSLRLAKFFSASRDLNKPMHDRELLMILTRDLIRKDTLVVYEASNLGRSICQVIEVLKMALNRGVNVHFVKVDLVFEAEEFQSKEAIIRILSYVSDSFSARETTDNEVRRVKEVRPVLGRPKGRANTRLKLDDYEYDIMKYLDLKISKRSIARILECHPQTLQDWLVRRKVKENAA
jgi:DNA invertase Pin-like site-specific DNA recombinase